MKSVTGYCLAHKKKDTERLYTNKEKSCEQDEAKGQYVYMG